MGKKRHSEGFENEKRFFMIFCEARENSDRISFSTVKRIIAHFDPDFVENLFKVRPCVRKLKYIGDCSDSDENYCSNSHHFFEVGKIYTSIDFTGATYSIEGYDPENKRVGLSYFEIVDDC